MTAAAQRKNFEASGPSDVSFGQEWPHGVSHTPTMNIGQVVSRIRVEFPALSISKVRYLGEQGIVNPKRTPSGYRKYSEADIERIRYALTVQRDSYAPLQVIAEQLSQLDAGHQLEEVPTARVVSNRGKNLAPKTGSVGLRELMDYTGALREEIEGLVNAGLIATDLKGRFPVRTIKIVKHCRLLMGHGLEPRHLRPVRNSAERCAEVVDHLVTPIKARPTGISRERANARAGELAEVFAALHTELLRAAVERNT